MLSFALSGTRADAALANLAGSVTRFAAEK